MHRAPLLNIIIIATLLIAIAVNIYSKEKVPGAASAISELQLVMPEADVFKEKQEPFVYYEAYNKNRLIGHCFYSIDVAPEEKGYGGFMQILVCLGKDDKIKNLRILYHNEAPQHTHTITGPEFLDQFKGKGHGDAFIIGEDIDAITHATISSRAVATILKTSVHKLQAAIHGYKKVKPGKQPLNLDIDFYLTILIITFFLVAFYLKKSLLRYAGLFISVVYFGFVKANFISMSNLGSIFLWRLPDPRSNVAWYVFIFSGIGLTFVFTKFYCTYMCPFLGLQIFLNKILKFNIKITAALGKRLRRIRFFLLWILTILVLILNNQNIVNYEPFSTVFLRSGSIVAWCILLIVLGMSLFHHRPFCHYFCATGAFLDILSGWGRRIFRKKT